MFDETQSSSVFEAWATFVPCDLMLFFFFFFETGMPLVGRGGTLVLFELFFFKSGSDTCAPKLNFGSTALSL